MLGKKMKVALFIYGWLVSMLLVSCAGSPVTSDTIAMPTQEDTAVPAPTQTVIAQNTPEQVVLPTPRSEMEATDPDMVQLASGKPQLLEFFAFW